MNIDKETEKRIGELQILEQQLQKFLMEKQTMQVELNEIENALGELDKTNDEAYKILGGIMIKSNKEELIKEMKEKKKILEIRINSIEKQEVLLSNKSEEMKKELRETLKEKKE
ncbi:MAG: prefoldin subunit beta [Patescibacteria group bacterium]